MRWFRDVFRLLGEYRQACRDEKAAMRALDRKVESLRVEQESKAFTTVSVPRPPANAQNLDQFVGQYDPGPAQALPSTLQYGWQYY